MSFWNYLIALFCPPLHFFLQKRWGVFVVHAVLYVLAIFTFFVFFFGTFIWAILAGHALWDVRKHMVHEFVDKQARAIAAEMNRPKA